MTDSYTPQTKRYHSYLKAWLKNDKEKLEKGRVRSREHARKKRENNKRSAKKNNMKPIEVGRSLVE